MNLFNNYQNIKNSYPILFEKFLVDPLHLKSNSINYILNKQKGNNKYNYVKLFAYYKNLFRYLIENNFKDIEKYIDKIPVNLKNLHYNNISIKNIELIDYKYNNPLYDKICNELKDTEIIVFFNDLVKEVYKLITNDYIKDIVISDKKNLELYVKWKAKQLYSDEISEKVIKNIIKEIKNNTIFINIDNINKKDIFNNIFFFFNQLLKEIKEKNFLMEEEIDFIKLIANDLYSIKPFLNDYYFLLPLTYLYIFRNKNKLNSNIFEEALFHLKRKKSF